MVSSSVFAEAVSTMCSVLFSEPFAEMPYATYFPSSDGNHQSSAVVPSVDMVLT